ncbi:MAG: phosphotransferase [Chloroflexota bacterium]
MPVGLTAVLRDHYALASIQQIQPITAGFLSQNWTLQLADTRYFLKQYRFKEEARIQGVHASKFFFAEAGAPVVLPLLGRNGRSYFQHNHKFYALFPYVVGRKPQRGALTVTELESMATHLAHLHRAGQGKTIAELPTVSRQWCRNDFAINIAKILALIEQKVEKMPFDQLAEQKLRLKQKLASQIDYAYGDLGLAHDCLIHGDYHPDNLFVDEAGHIKAIYDLEKSEHSHRLLELVRSVEFGCFSPSSGYGFLVNKANFKSAAHYLRIYQRIFPFRAEELRTAYLAHVGKRVFSLWVEREHYLHNNARVAPFLMAGWQSLAYFAENFELFVAKITREIFS